MVSKAYPDLERKPGGPDNWVEAAGGLPDYIERIAKRLHYERGYSISRAIATAVNTVKRWAKGGTVTKSGTVKTVSPATIAKAIIAVGQWEAKKKAGALALSEDLQFAIDLSEDDDWESEAFDLFDLANADIDSTSTMIALYPPADVAESLAVEGGVPASELHVTITFNGDTEENDFNALAEAVKQWAEDAPMDVTLEGTVGGIGAFPASDESKGTPWFVPVDIPGLNTLHEQMKAVADKFAPAAENHGYTPHMTLTYGAEGETPPSPVASTPVKFTELWVVRGNTMRVKVPLGAETGADQTGHAILSEDDVDLSKEVMDIEALANRANAISDPDERALARSVVLDLASSIAPRNAKGLATDGRRSYASQGKWKHGFIPANRAAKEAKAKGSPIAIKRLSRLFGKDKVKDDARKNNREPINPPKNKTTKVRKASAPTGRAGGRSAFGRKNDNLEVKIGERKTRGSESAQDVGALRNTKFEDHKETVRDEDNSQEEVSRVSRVPERATQNWDEIPEKLKTLRNGKRYVMAEFGGKNIITEWVGGIDTVTQTDLKNRKVMSSITAADAASMSTPELRAMLKNPKTPASVRKVLRKALNIEVERKARRG